MKLDFTDLPVGDGGLSPQVIEELWEKLGGSLERTGVEEFRREQRDIVGRISHNAAGHVLTAYGKEVAVVLPVHFSKVAVALVHLAENARVNAAMDEEDRNADKSVISLEDLLSEDNNRGASQAMTR